MTNEGATVVVVLVEAAVVVVDDDVVVAGSFVVEVEVLGTAMVELVVDGSTMEVEAVPPVDDDRVVVPESDEHAKTSCEATRKASHRDREVIAAEVSTQGLVLLVTEAHVRRLTLPSVFLAAVASAGKHSQRARARTQLQRHAQVGRLTIEGDRQ
jgi:hypothetical protein